MKQIYLCWLLAIELCAAHEGGFWGNPTIAHPRMGLPLHSHAHFGTIRGGNGQTNSQPLFCNLRESQT